MDALVTTALVGTAQRRDVECATGTPVDTLFEEPHVVEDERRLLFQAGALAVYRTAGATPEAGVRALEPAPVETLPACSSAAAELIHGFLSGMHPELLPEAVERLRRAGLRLPFDLLPLALSTRDYRDALAPVLGGRGRWLSRLNPAWTWARAVLADDSAGLPENAETIWQEGTAVERVAILRRLRASEPTRAHEWLAGVWKREKAEMRADLVDTLGVSLSAGDEAFLEAALDDRSTAVRERAALLLARLPGSALAGRLIARADAVLSYDGDTLKVNPPKTLEKDAVRDGLVEKSPAGTSERAWWLMQLLCRVAPTHWHERFGVAPDVLVAAIESSTWMWSVLEGWARGFLLHGDDAWILPLWRVWSMPLRKGMNRQQERHDEVRAKLAPHVPREELERLAFRLLAGEGADFPMSADEVLHILPHPWSLDLGNAYLSGLRAFVSSVTSTTSDFEPWDDTLEAAALGIPPECFAAALEPVTLPEGGVHWYLQQFRRQLENFADAIRLRQRVMEEIPL